MKDHADVVHEDSDTETETESELSDYDNASCYRDEEVFVGKVTLEEIRVNRRVGGRRTTVMSSRQRLSVSSSLDEEVSENSEIYEIEKVEESEKFEQAKAKLNQVKQNIDNQHNKVTHLFPNMLSVIDEMPNLEGNLLENITNRLNKLNEARKKLRIDLDSNSNTEMLTNRFENVSKKLNNSVTKTAEISKLLEEKQNFLVQVQEKRISVSQNRD